MKNITVLIGSLRKESYNRKLFLALKASAPEGVSLEEAPIDLPLFNEDAENPFPEKATTLKKAIEDADGIIIISPEYNRSIPGALKNALDWTSRGGSSFGGKKVATAGASTGRLGTAPMQQHLRSVLVYFNARVMGQPELYVSNAGSVFAEDGTVADEKTAEALKKFWDAFTAFLEE